MWMSILGMYEYDPTVFNGLNLPTYTDDNQVIHSIDREALLNNILLECAELEVIYPKIETMKIAISAWSVANQKKWQKLLATEYVNYNPIWNVDANITETEQRDINRTGSGSNNRTVNLADNRTVDLSDIRTVDLDDNRTVNLADNETVDLTDTESVKGFNSDTWAESKKNVKTGTDNLSHTGTDNISHTGTDDTVHSGTDNTTHTGTDNAVLSNTEKVDDDVTRSQRRTGNIGVTATQDLIEKERSIAEFSIINYITLSFKERFCLLVY